MRYALYFTNNQVLAAASNVSADDAIDELRRACGHDYVSSGRHKGDVALVEFHDDEVEPATDMASMIAMGGDVTRFYDLDDAA